MCSIVLSIILVALSASASAVQSVSWRDRRTQEYNEAMEKCQKCGGKVKEVIYGLVAPTPELEESLKNDEVVLGGCVTSGNDPHYVCNCSNTSNGSR